MRSEDLKYMLPDIPDEISDRMRNDIEDCIANKAGIHKTKNNSKILRVAAALAAVLVAGSTVYAANYAIKLKTEKEGNYGINVDIVTEGTTENLSDMKAQSEYKAFDYNFGAKPDGMDEYLNAGGKLNDNTDPDRYFSPMLVHIDKSVDFDELRLGHVVDNRDVVVAGIPGTRVEFSDGRVWYYMLYEDKNAVLVAMTGSALSDEDFEIIMSGFEIEVTDEVLTAEEAFKWSDYVEAESEYNIGYDYGDVDIPSYPIADLSNLKNLNESADISNSAVTEDGKELGAGSLSVKVTDVKAYDDFSVLEDKEMLGYQPQWLKSLDEDGKLKQNTIYAYKAGDGINELDEVIDEVKVDEKLVYATLEFTNTSDETLYDVWFTAEIEFLRENKDSYNLSRGFEQFRFEGLDDFAYALYEYAARDDSSMLYWDVHNEYFKNYIPEIKAGETVTVNVAYLLNEDVLPYVVMVVNDTDYGYNINGNNAWFDLRNKIEIVE
ncbi:MAG: hypothetical protein IJ763_08250 [Lachnospiraceae bacterium]|nr:hypothetical protein [Lachnospiraceae bacterium]